MLLQDSRRAARIDAAGDLVLLEDQDRRRWNRSQISEDCALVERALVSRRAGSYALQAAIAALHAEAVDAAGTDWAQFVALYDLLLQREPSPVVALNLAVALAMGRGAAVGLAAIDALLQAGELPSYRPAQAARAELLLRCGRREEAPAGFERCLALNPTEPERRHLLRRLAVLAEG